jgi:radical SAM protein with 4Fe4S-binding SPASM domain
MNVLDEPHPHIDRSAGPWVPRRSPLTSTHPLSRCAAQGGRTRGGLLTATRPLPAPKDGSAFLAPLGKAAEDPLHLLELVGSPAQRAFGTAKLVTLPQYCLDCDVRFACNGGCPKDRFATTPDGESGLHHLCAGYKAFFSHIDAPMRFMADRLRAGQDATALRNLYAAADAQRGRNDPCTCGSGRKFKRCHGAPTIVAGNA